MNYHKTILFLFLITIICSCNEDDDPNFIGTYRAAIDIYPEQTELRGLDVDSDLFTITTFIYRTDSKVWDEVFDPPQQFGYETSGNNLTLENGVTYVLEGGSIRGTNEVDLRTYRPIGGHPQDDVNDCEQNIIDQASELHLQYFQCNLDGDTQCSQDLAFELEVTLDQQVKACLD